MSFPSPVSVSANTVYVASYFCPGGHYSADQNYFAAGRDSAPLHAPADGAQGGNGLFTYGAASAFPTQTYLASNYWVDVVFSPTPTTPTPTPQPPSGGSATTPSAPRSGGGDHESCGCGTSSVPGGAGLCIGAALCLLFLSRKPS
jgi:hypothetical protein